MKIEITPHGTRRPRPKPAPTTRDGAPSRATVEVATARARPAG